MSFMFRIVGLAIGPRPVICKGYVLVHADRNQKKLDFIKLGGSGNMSQSQTEVDNILYSARRILRTFKWTQGTNARDSRGMSVSTANSDAVAFCLWGAICRANWTLSNCGTALLSASTLVRNTLGPRGKMNISGFNDTKGRTKEEILAVLDKAIHENSVPRS